MRVFINLFGLSLLILMCGCETRPLTEQSCTISGRIVTDAENAPIIGARVLVTVPDIDSSVSPFYFGQVYGGVTGVNGRYTIAGLPARAGASIDLIAKAKGYQTPWSKGNENEPMPKVTLQAGIVEAADLKLKKGGSLFWSGTVVDEMGRPIKDVNVTCNRLIDSSDERGAFEIIDESLQKGEFDSVLFIHPDYMVTRVYNIFLMPLAEREQMRIVLKSGTKIEGILLGPGGKPMPSTLVQIRTLGVPVNPSYKGAMTDDWGRFSIKGIVPDVYRLCATTPNASGAVVVDLTRDKDNVTLRLATAYTGRSRTVQFLGMTLAEADYALAEHWGLRVGNVIVLDPGTKVGQLGPYKLKAWTRIVRVESSGNDKIGDVTSLSDLISKLIDAGDSQLHGKDPVDVELSTCFPSPRGDVSSGFSIKLSMSDIQEARILLKTLNGNKKF